jgi:outer membrane protein OmpA-like peptidoglycan-associated protein
MNKVLNFALVASLATSAFSQEAPKALRHEMMFNVGVNMAGVERGDNNSIHGPFSTDWANAPIHLNVGHLYAVNPLLSTVVTLDYSRLAGVNSVEEFTTNSISPMVGINFRPFNVGKNPFNNLYIQALAGVSAYSAERKLVDLAMHASLSDVAFAFTPTLGYRIPTKSGIAWNLSASMPSIVNDNFDGDGFGVNNNDMYARLNVGMIWTLGNKSGGKSVAMSNQEVLSKDMLDPLATKASVQAVEGSVKKVEERVGKLEGTIPSLLKRADLDPLVRKMLEDEKVASQMNGGAASIRNIVSVYYRFDRDVIDQQYFATIDAFMAGYNEGSKIMLVGFADMTGSKDYNMKLSRDRAEGVKDYIMRKFKVASNMITIQVGDLATLAPDKPELNRRVDMYLY